jgi:putative flippase GtrA
MLAQLIRFAGVGGVATLAHVLVALAVQAALPVTPQQANLAGFGAGVAVSYTGHARVTFGAPLRLGAQFARFFLLSLLGLSASSVTVQVTTSLLGWGFGAAMAAVAVIVPACSYLAMRFWVFARRGERAE